jgi:hypothetical protein
MAQFMETDPGRKLQVQTCESLPLPPKTPPHCSSFSLYLLFGTSKIHVLKTFQSAPSNIVDSLPQMQGMMCIEKATSISEEASWVVELVAF